MVSLQDEQGLVHVYPMFGAAHILEGLSCWCEPVRDDEVPTVIIHTASH